MTIGWILALLVLILAVVLAATGALALPIGGLIAALALVPLVDRWPWWTRNAP